MFDKLKKLLDKSFSPYSGYRVASIIIDAEGNEYSGVNVESVSYGATTCAERVAIQTAITNGMDHKSVKEVHLVAFNTNSDVQKLTTPCGICRQVIAEQSKNQAKVFTYNYDTGEVTESLISDLLPNSFEEGDLIV
jgi:cytidine deaminase